MQSGYRDSTKQGSRTNTWPGVSKAVVDRLCKNNFGTQWSLEAPVLEDCEENVFVVVGEIGTSGAAGG